VVESGLKVARNGGKWRGRPSRASSSSEGL
jgi:hypothetical protein